MTGPIRVLVCSGTYMYSILHPRKEWGLLEELRARGFEVHQLALDTHAPHFPPGALQAPPGIMVEAARRLGAALWQLAWADVVVVPSHRYSPQVVEWARALEKVTVQHDDHGGTDSRYMGADWVAVKGPWFREHILQRNPELADRVISTGCIEYDDIQAPEWKQWTREAFCREYGLDPAKRIAAWLPSAIFRQDAWAVAKYREICRIVQDCPNHQLIIKGHASDYARYVRGAHKGFDGKSSWEVLAPGAAVSRPEHTTLCLLHCDLGLTIHSSVGLEFPLYGKPLVYVDAFNTPRVQLREKAAPASKFPIQDWAAWPVPWSPAFIGVSVTAAELAQVLAEVQYDVATPEQCAAHVARFYVANDGQAFRRLADVISRAAEAARPEARAAWSTRRRWLALVTRNALTAVRESARREETRELT